MAEVYTLALLGWPHPLTEIVTLVVTAQVYTLEEKLVLDAYLRRMGITAYILGVRTQPNSKSHCHATEGGDITQPN